MGTKAPFHFVRMNRLASTAQLASPGRWKPVERVSSAPGVMGKRLSRAAERKWRAAFCTKVRAPKFMSSYVSDCVTVQNGAAGPALLKFATEVDPVRGTMDLRS
jgi:hypothetical protein